MKTIFPAFIALIVCIPAFSQPKEVTGTWLGTIDVGVKLRLVFNFIKNADGSLSGTTDSPDQNIKDIPLSEVRLKVLL